VTDIAGAIARLAALVEFLAGVGADENEERAAAQDGRLAQARAARADIEAAIAAAYAEELGRLVGFEETVRRDDVPPIARAIARTRRLEREAALALVSMRLERAIVDYGHAYAIATAALVTS
jgi:hypothetical protein